MNREKQTHGSRPAPPESAGHEYRRPMPATWWLQRGTYQRFMLREATSVFVAAYALFLLVLAGLGPAAFHAVLTHPLTVALHLFALLMAVYHSVTWFNLTPQVIVIWRGQQRVSPWIIAGVHYAGWAVASLVLLGIVKTYAGG